MRVTCRLFQNMHLNRTYSLLTGRNVKVIYDLFCMLDVHNDQSLNDVQFFAFLATVTDLTESQSNAVFDMLDVDGSGSIDINEFYLLICIFIAVQDRDEKQVKFFLEIKKVSKFLLYFPYTNNRSMFSSNVSPISSNQVSSPFPLRPLFLDFQIKCPLFIKWTIRLGKGNTKSNKKF